MRRSSDAGKIVFRIILLLVCAALAGYFVYSRGSRRAVAGLEEPVQTEAEGTVKLHHDGYDIVLTYRAAYETDALVVHKKNYSSGLTGYLAPVDLALAWGDVAAYNTKIDFHWSQSGRWYFWNVDSYEELAPVGDESDVTRQSANTHIIPANGAVRRKIKRIRRGDRVKLKGYLVDMDAENSKGDKRWWHTSLMRTDMGDGSCEVMYVTDAEIVK